MNRGIDAAASGMIANTKWLEAISSNLANSNTTGFKSEGISFSDAMERKLRADGGLGPEIGSIGSGAIERNRYVNWQPGNFTETGNPLDLALRDAKTMFAIQTPQGIQYTRSGSFTLNEERLVVTREGYPVLDDQKRPIQIPPGTFRISPDGTISHENQPAGRVGVFAGEFTRVSGTLFSANATQAADGAVILPGALESSNVNVIENMIAMVQIGRNYEMAQKTIQQQDELTTKLLQAMQSQ
ncbi:MAG TPA: flagellar hook-basal body protein [Fimbriimonadaceae bacterium]|nr:flagellar hook-basal body protein [Fimbriimonadaceae bacterium]HRJ32519.1 flagellar hook-basal body protein [Fimbriimonadaceae bacterium]